MKSVNAVPQISQTFKIYLKCSPNLLIIHKIEDDMLLKLYFPHSMHFVLLKLIKYSWRNSTRTYLNRAMAPVVFACVRTSVPHTGFLHV